MHCKLLQIYIVSIWKLQDSLQLLLNILFLYLIRDIHPINVSQSVHLHFLLPQYSNVQRKENYGENNGIAKAKESLIRIWYSCFSCCQLDTSDALWQ